MTYWPPLCCYGNARCLCKQKGPISQSGGHFTPHQPQLPQDQTILIHVPLTKFADGGQTEEKPWPLIHSQVCRAVSIPFLTLQSFFFIETME